MFTVWLVSSAAAGYVLGSLPFGYLVARSHGVDIFKVGSGNPGATNVKRMVGARAGHTVVVLDVLKGAVATGWPMLPVLAAPQPLMLGLVGVVAAVLGHSFSLFTKFRGGKGVATAAGGLLVLMPVACAIAAATWVVSFYAFRYVSLASILAAAAVVVAGWLLPYDLAISIIASVIGGFVIVRHNGNIRRLLAGTESRFAKKPRGPA
jgi:glycerol-3-phosphate acyltransferase PlsY